MKTTRSILLFIAITFSVGTACDRNIPVVETSAEAARSSGALKRTETRAEDTSGNPLVENEAPTAYLRQAFRSLENGDPKKAVALLGEFQDRDASASCYKRYGLMLSHAMLFIRAVDSQLAPGLGATLAFLRKDPKALDAELRKLVGGDKPASTTALLHLEETVTNSDAVLEQGCFEWRQNVGAPTASDVEETDGVDGLWNMIAKWLGFGAQGPPEPIGPAFECSTPPLSQEVGLCGVRLSNLSVAFESRPDSDGAAELVPAWKAIEFIGGAKSPVLSANFAGEWDRGEAAIISTVGHFALAFSYLAMGVRTGSNMELAGFYTTPVPRLRAYGHVVAEDPLYLTADEEYATQLAMVPRELAAGFRGLSRLPGEFTSDVDDQSDDVVGFYDFGEEGIDGGDVFEVKASELAVLGLSAGRTVSILQAWRTKGFLAALKAIPSNNPRVILPLGWTKARITGWERLSALLADRLDAVDNPVLSDILTSAEIGDVLFAHGLVSQRPSGFAKANLRPLFDTLNTHGLRAFAPKVVAGESHRELAIENEVAEQFSRIAYNSEMTTGESRHFTEDGFLLEHDCAAPGQSADTPDQVYYYLFDDPTFGRGLEINRDAFDEPCSGDTATQDDNYMLNKWVAKFGVPLPVLVNSIITLKDNPLVGLARASLTGDKSGWSLFEQRLLAAAVPMDE